MPERLLLLIVSLYAIFAGGLATVRAAQEPVSPAGDQVLSYASDITVHLDNTLLVRESLRVLAITAQRNRALCREVPTRYSDRFGNPYTIHVEVLSLERDSQPDTFQLERAANGLRVCWGNDAISPGEHNYELTFKADRGIGFFADHDELYWNVTGNDWTLPLQAVTASVHLPKGIAPQAILVDGYTGPPGAVGTDFAASAEQSSSATFETTRPLAPGEALTIVVRWPKNFVLPPTEEQIRQYWREDNEPLLIGGLGLLAVLVYFIVAWFMVVQNPGRVAIAPGSEAPWGLSPVTIRYLWSGAFDRKTMVVSLIDLAVKGRLIIQEDGSGGYAIDHLRSGGGPNGAAGPISASLPGVTADEKLVIGKLFAADEAIRLEPGGPARIGGAIEALRQHLRRKREKLYWTAQRRYLIPGVLMSLAIVVRCGLGIQGVAQIPLWGLTLGLLPWSLGCVWLVVFALVVWKDSLTDPYHVPTARKQALRLSALAIIFLAGEVAGWWALARVASGQVMLILFGLLLLNSLFYYLAKSPKRAGSRMVKQIEMFRDFLSATREGGSARSKPMTRVLDVSERFLPYAIALNVEKAWGEKFGAALALRARQTIGYAPEWYSGPAWDPINISNFPTALGNSCSRAMANSLRRG